MANVSFIPDNPEHFSASLVLFFSSALYSAPGEHSIPSVLNVHERQDGGLLLGTHFRPKVLRIYLRLVTKLRHNMSKITYAK
jgi:hypothetical protein